MASKGKNWLLFSLLGLVLILILVILILEGVFIWILFKEVGKLKSKMVPEDTEDVEEAIRPQMNQEVDISHDQGIHTYILHFSRLYIRIRISNFNNTHTYIRILYIIIYNDSCCFCTLYS